MSALTGKNMVVIGGSRGVGRRIVEAGLRNGARVLAVARQEARSGNWPRRSPALRFWRSMRLTKARPQGFDSLARTSWCSALARFLRPRHSTSRAGGSSPSTGRLTSRSHFISARRRCCGRCPQAPRSSCLQWRRARGLAEFGRICRRQAHAALHRELRPEGIGSARARPALHGACAAASCRTPSSEGMLSLVIRSYLGESRRPTSFRAWLRRRVRPTSRTGVIELADQPGSIQGKGLRRLRTGPRSRARMIKRLKDDRRRSNVGPDDSD